MENNAGMPPSSTPAPSGPSPAAARQALDALAAGRVELAGRLVTPPWYHPALAALVFVLVAGYGFERIWLVSLLVYSLGLVWLMKTYRRITGLWTLSWAVIGGRRYLLGLVAVMLSCFAVAHAARAGSLPWWSALVAGAVSSLAVLWVGPRFDVALRQSLRVTR